MSSSLSPKEAYDVFISFRGEDTRSNFTSHLYSSLCQACIKTFIDDGHLPKGREVWPTLSQAIYSSHIAIVVFSENYASSKWCLKELIKILKCRKSQGQVVIPVFYEVDPSNIRKQTGSYGEAFSKHERLLQENNDDEYIQKKLSKWKIALTEGANISGWDSRDVKNDSEVIKKIVEDVLQKLYPRYPPELKFEGLVGIENILEYFESLLSTNEDNQLLKNVKVIGIWGMGGIGKTTVAKAVFSQFSPQYDNVCFLANIREETKRLGQTSLCDKLLFDLLKDEQPKYNHIGFELTTRRLVGRKVFIVLDDVDSLDQLDDLYEVYKHAGPESLLILTTRNKHLLVGRVDDIYEVNILSSVESLELFYLHAFKQRSPQVGYEDLSRTAVKYAQGLPLALKVLGSNLYSRSIEFWDNELKKVKSYPYNSIENVLRVSYDGLDIPQQKVFLDIAFFFRGEHKAVVERILNACGLFGTSGIKVLEDKTLITISNEDKIQMHDLIQEMGLNIVRQGMDPGRRSRLRDIEEVSDVLTNEKGSDAIEGISLDLSLIDNLLSLGANTFTEMTKLRFLRFYIPWQYIAGKVDYPIVFDKISNNLRYLEWYGYGLKSLPTNFSPKMLVEIHMPYSHVVELWQGVQACANLKEINLTGCYQLKKLPDLSKASKLKSMNLSDCESLVEVHPSILSLDTLEVLILENCKKLENLKSNKHLISLRKLSVYGCTDLKEFSISSDKIENLDLSKTGIEELHSSLGNLTRLKSLYLECLRLRNIPNCRLSASLTDLRISNCRVDMDKQRLHDLFEGLTCLTYLHLTNCCKMSEIPDNISNLSELYELRLDRSSVEQLPESVKHLPNLEILHTENCRKLRWLLPEFPPKLRELNAANCTSMVVGSTYKFHGTLVPQYQKNMSFRNCMKLDGRYIVEDTLKNILIALFHDNYEKESNPFAYSYTNVKVCLAGSTVPMQFAYRTTGSSVSITIPSKPLMGVVLCAVLSPFQELKHGARICCQCYLADGTKLGHVTSCYHAATTHLDSDNVYIWCDSYHFDSIVQSRHDFKPQHYEDLQLSFEFYVTKSNDMGGYDVLNFPIKVCGAHPITLSKDVYCFILGSYSESGKELDHNIAQRVERDLGLGSDSDSDLDFESQYDETVTAIERSDEQECTDQNNQEGEVREKCSCSSYCFFDVLRYLWRRIIRT